VAEVYAPTAAALALCLLLVDAAAAGQRRAGVALALIGGLSLGLHAQLRILLGPPCAILALSRLRRGARWPLVGPMAVAVGAAVVTYLPVRAARSPAADWADPRTLAGVIRHLSAARIRGAFAGEMLSRDPQVVWTHLGDYARLVEGQLGAPALLCALGGLVWLLRTRRPLGLILGALVVGDAIYAAWINPMGLDDLQDGGPGRGGRAGGGAAERPRRAVRRRRAGGDPGGAGAARRAVGQGGPRPRGGGLDPRRPRPAAARAAPRHQR
jgi:hypothetical protein